jgi:hypothetical protein
MVEGWQVKHGEAASSICLEILVGGFKHEFYVP